MIERRQNMLMQLWKANIWKILIFVIGAIFAAGGTWDSLNNRISANAVEISEIKSQSVKDKDEILKAIGNVEAKTDEINRFLRKGKQ